MECTAVDNVVYTGNNRIFKVHTRLRVQQYAFYYLPADVYKLNKHVRWRVQQSTTLCTLVSTEYFKYIRGCVYNGTFYYLPADVDKLYKHVRWRAHRRWRVQQSITLCTLVTTGYLKYIRGCVYNSMHFIIFQPTCTN